MPATALPQTGAATTLALKEWGAVACALLDGRQTLLLRKGGIAEKAFSLNGVTTPFVLFPTVAHSHRERVRCEHHDVLACGEAQVDPHANTFVVRVGLTVVGAVPVRRPARLHLVEDLHIWTDASVQAERVDFRPKHALQALVVRAVALPRPVVLERIQAYGGCKSWVDLPALDGGISGAAVHPDERLAADLERVRTAVT